MQIKEQQNTGFRFRQPQRSGPSYIPTSARSAEQILQEKLSTSGTKQSFVDISPRTHGLTRNAANLSATTDYVHEPDTKISNPEKIKRAVSELFQPSISMSSVLEQMPSMISGNTLLSRPAIVVPSFPVPMPKYKKIKNMALKVVAILLFFGIMAFAGKYVYQNKFIEKSAKTTVRAPHSKVFTSVKGLSTLQNKPSQQELASYSVSPSLSRYLRVSSLGIESRVSTVGIGANNELESPISIHDAAWYTYSAKPTDKTGAMLLVGHASGVDLDGVFSHLYALKEGDLIQIERGDGVRLNFKVQQITQYVAKEVDMADALSPKDNSRLGLNILTVSGSLDKSVVSYDKRILIKASLDK